MGIKPVNNQAYQLLHDGTIALSKVESNGIRVDLDYLEKQQKSVSMEKKE